MSAVTEPSETTTAKGPAPKEAKRKGLDSGQGRRGLLLVLPTLIFLAGIIIYPLLKAVQLSFTKDQGLDPTTGLFVEGGSAGVSNYTLLAAPALR